MNVTVRVVCHRWLTLRIEPERYMEVYSGAGPARSGSRSWPVQARSAMLLVAKKGMLTMTARSIRRRLVALVAGGGLLGVAVAAVAQRGLLSSPDPEPGIRNVRYDGRFTFARVKYTTGPGGYYYCGLPAWAHGYASCRGGTRAERSLMQIMKEISY